MPTKYPEEMKRKVVSLANNGKNQAKGTPSLST